MMYQSTLKIPYDEKIVRLFDAEDKDFGRSTYTVEKNSTHIVITVSAEDATALKIAYNTISKILLVWEKTTKLVKGD